MVCRVLSLILFSGIALAQEDEEDVGKPLVEVRRYPHAPTCPAKCRTCILAAARALDYLAKNTTAEGLEAGNGGDLVVTAIAGLAFMANGSTPTAGPYARQVEQAAQFVMRRVDQKCRMKTGSGQEFEAYSNWDLSFAALFLCEVYIQRPGPALEKKLRWIADRICEQREATGGWGHAPNAAYGDLTVVTNACLAALGSLRLIRLGIPDDVIANGVKYLESTSEGGRVGYSPRENQKGWGWAGRASGAGYAMLKCGVNPAHPYYRRVQTFVKSNLKTIPRDHASPTLHFLNGGLYAFMLGADAWREYRAQFLDLWLSAQRPDGSFTCPTKSDLQARREDAMDAIVGPNYTTAVCALVWALPYDRTFLTRATLRASRPATATRESKQPTNGWLGLRLRTSHKSFVVTSVAADSPAEKAGIERQAIVVEFNKKPVRDAKSVREALNQLKPGTKVSLTLLGSDGRKIVELSVAERPAPPDGGNVGTPSVDEDGGEEV